MYKHSHHLDFGAKAAATATIVGAAVLAQLPSGRDLLGVSLVMHGVALHRPPPA